MKKIDLTQPGGFPFTQDQLNYLQTAYTECLKALADIGGSAGAGAVPVIITGMAVSGGGNTVSSGWCYYNGELLKFTGGTVVPGGGEVALVLITETATPLTFNDSSTPNVIIEYTASLTHAATVTDATHFPVSALVPWVAIDPTLYGDITTINGQIATLDEFLANIGGQWTSGAAVTFAVTGGTLAATGGTVVYNNFLLVGNTLSWSVQIRAGTITGTPSAIKLKLPTAITALLSGGWINNGSFKQFSYNVSGTRQSAFMQLDNASPIGVKLLISGLGAGSFDMDIDIRMEEVEATY